MKGAPAMKVASEAIGAVASRRATSLAAIVQGEIERMIVAGELEAGQRLNEQHLATQLGVSRGPVREALRSLERAGLVNGIANLGMFVRQVGIEEAIEMYEMRALVFGFACARVADRATDEQKESLRALVTRMQEAIDGKDGGEYYRLNLAFHDLIMEYAGHDRANQIYQSLVKEGHLLRQRSLRPDSSMRESNAEHAGIVDAIAAGDTAAARKAAEEHHLLGRTRWLDTLTR
jgi:DNA-binding GntR family transcriptional regulator